VPVDLSRIERPVHERSQMPQNRCLAERVGGRARRWRLLLLTMRQREFIATPSSAAAWPPEASPN
jgi:hypothetical protein